MAFGRRYGLVGRNGTGKTTLLRAMAQHQIKGIPENCQILHVEQEVSHLQRSVAVLYRHSYNSLWRGCMHSSLYFFMYSSSSSSSFCWAHSCSPVLSLSLVPSHCCMQSTLSFFFCVFFFLFLCLLLGFQCNLSYSVLCFEPVVRCMQVVHTCSSLSV